MPSVVSQRSDVFDTSLVSNNNNDQIYQLNKKGLQIFFSPTLQISKRIINFDANAVGIDYSIGIGSLMVCTKNGLLYLWDMREKTSHTSLQSREQISDTLFTCCSISNDGSLICCGTELTKINHNYSSKYSVDSESSDDETDRKSKYAYLVYWDPRFLLHPLGVHKKLHTDDITDVHFDPTSIPGYQRLLTCAEDGLLYAIDLHASKESNAVLQIFNSESVPTSCNWLLSPTCPNLPNGVYCTTTMQTHAKMWSVIDKQIESGSVELNLTCSDQTKLDVTDGIWKQKLNTLKAHKYLRIKCVSDHDFVVLGDVVNGEKRQPGIFHCYDNPTQNPLGTFEDWDSLHADFLGPASNGLCFFVGSSSVILSNWT